MASNPLIIVDCQRYFLDCISKEAYNESLIRFGKIAKLTMTAIKNHLPIILLQWSPTNLESGWDEGSGNWNAQNLTDYRIRKALDLYKNTITVEKTSDGGGDEVKYACKKLNINPTTFNICGINASACVFKTMSELHKHKFNVINNLTFNSWDPHMMTMKAISDGYENYGNTEYIMPVSCEVSSQLT